MNEHNSNKSKTATALDSEFADVTLKDWQTLAIKSLRGPASLKEIERVTASGQSIDVLYHDRPAASNTTATVSKLQAIDHRLRVLGSTAKSRKEHILRGLNGGMTSLEIALPMHSDRTDNLTEQLAEELAGTHLSLINISLQAEHSYANAAGALRAVWKAQALDENTAAASFNADPIGSLLRAGFLENDIETELQAMAKFAASTKQQLPASHAVSINCAYHHNAGASDTQELTAAIATASLYMDAMLDAGMRAKDAADSIVFQFACDADHLMGVVKLRTLKQLWQHIAAALGVNDVQLNLVVETSSRMLSKRSPWVNHLRNVNAVSSAMMAGARTVITQPHTFIENTFIDDKQLIAERVARNTSIILEQECALNFVHDPMAGAYSVEQLTQQLLDTTWQALKDIEAQGGFVSLIKIGAWQEQINHSFIQRQARLQSEQQIAVGVNRYNDEPVAQPASKAKLTQTADNATGNSVETVTPLPTSALTRVAALTPKRDAQIFEEQR